jgi:hypothetical protein
MKKIFAALAILLFLCGPSSAGDEKHQPKKLKTTFTIVFNEITLQEAADWERRINKDFASACSVSVKTEQVDNVITSNFVIYSNSVDGSK